MKSNKLMLWAGVAVGALCFAPVSHAQTPDNYTVILTQSAPNQITATGSGMIDLTGLTSVANPSPDPSYVDLIAGQNTTANTGMYFLTSGNALSTYAEYSGTFSGAGDFGSGTASEIGSGSGNYVGINTAADYILVPTSYASGGSLSSSAMFIGDFSTLGLVNGTSFTYDLGNGSTYTIDIGTPSATPEPGSFVLLGTGLLGFAGVLRRRLR